jgi:molybdopterin molybdotransferase
MTSPIAGTDPHSGKPRELFNVLPPQDALRRLLEHLPTRRAAEHIRTADALDRVLAEDLVSPEDLPSFPRSTMDGFAVRAADTYGASEGLPAYLNIVGEVLMGRSPSVTLTVGQAARIATGGMVPTGADAVVMIEQTQEASGSLIEVLRPVAVGENVIQIGEDVTRGAPLLARGHTLRSQDIGGLLAMGATEVPVVRKARVGIISSGDEVVAPDQAPAPGQIRDINSYTLAALVRRAGHDPHVLGIVPDVYERLAETAQHALREHDMLILSAGSSVSTRDMTADVIASLGSPGVLVHGVSLRPGKPTILAVADGKPVFGLPGNPVSCMVTFDLFVAPTLAHINGQADVPRITRRARLTKNIASASGREDYVQVRLTQRDGEQWADPVFGKSNLIYTLVRSDGMVKVELNQGGLVEGAWVDVIMF